MPLLKRIAIMGSVVLVFISGSGCSKASPTLAVTDVPDLSASCSVGPVTSAPALYGMWVKETGDQRELLTITEQSAYLVEFAGVEGSDAVRETFYAIQSVDWVNSVVRMKMSWVRVNGKYGGFDSPAKLMKVNIDGETLFYSISDKDLGVPSDTANGPWVKK